MTATPSQVEEIKAKARSSMLPAFVVAHRLGVTMPMKLDTRAVRQLMKFDHDCFDIHCEDVWNWMVKERGYAVDEIRSDFWSGHGLDGYGDGIGEWIGKLKESVEEDWTDEHARPLAHKDFIAFRNHHINEMIDDAWNKDHGYVDEGEILSSYLQRF